MSDVVAVPIVVVVPVKPPVHGKSRLGDLPAAQREALAKAFALDTLAAVLETPEVHHALVVTDDAGLAREIGGTGCSVMPDGVTEDLNATLVQAAAEVARRWPTALVVALAGDLPSLRPADLSAVLHRVRALPDGGSAFVRDRSGTGTTLYAAAPATFAPAFGTGSARAHLEAGAADLEAAASVRLDVDDLADLTAALLAGVGPRTAGVTGRRT